MKFQSQLILLINIFMIVTLIKFRAGIAINDSSNPLKAYTPSFVVFKSTDEILSIDFSLTFEDKTTAETNSQSIYLYQGDKEAKLYCLFKENNVLCKQVPVQGNLTFLYLKLSADSTNALTPNAKIPLYIYHLKAGSSICQTRSDLAYENIIISIAQNTDDNYKLEMLFLKEKANPLVVIEGVRDNTSTSFTLIVNNKSSGQYSIYLRNKDSTEEIEAYQLITDKAYLLQIPAPTSFNPILYGQTDEKQSITLLFSSKINQSLDLIKIQVIQETNIKEETIFKEGIAPDDNKYTCDIILPLTFNTGKNYSVSIFNICNFNKNLGSFMLKSNTIEMTIKKYKKESSTNIYEFTIPLKHNILKDHKPTIQLKNSIEVISIKSENIEPIEDGISVKWKVNIHQSLLKEGIYLVQLINEKNTMTEPGIIFYEQDIELNKNNLSILQGKKMQFTITFSTPLFEGRITSISYESTNSLSQEDKGIIDIYPIKDKTIEINKIGKIFDYAGHYSFYLYDITQDSSFKYTFQVNVMVKTITAFTTNYVFLIDTRFSLSIENDITFIETVDSSLITSITTNPDAIVSFSLTPINSIGKTFKLKATVNDVNKLGQFKGITFAHDKDIIYENKVQQIIVVKIDSIPTAFSKFPDNITQERTDINFNVELNQIVYQNYLENKSITISDPKCTLAATADSSTLLLIKCQYEDKDFLDETGKLKLDFLGEKITITSFGNALPVFALLITNCDSTMQDWIPEKQKCQCKAGYDKDEFNNCVYYKITDISPRKLSIVDKERVEVIKITFNFNQPSEHVSHFIFYQKLADGTEITFLVGILSTKENVVSCKPVNIFNYPKGEYLVSWVAINNVTHNQDAFKVINENIFSFLSFNLLECYLIKEIFILPYSYVTPPPESENPFTFDANLRGPNNNFKLSKNSTHFFYDKAYPADWEGSVQFEITPEGAGTKSYYSQTTTISDVMLLSPVINKGDNILLKMKCLPLIALQSKKPNEENEKVKCSILETSYTCELPATVSYGDNTLLISSSELIFRVYKQYLPESSFVFYSMSINEINKDNHIVVLSEEFQLSRIAKVLLEPREAGEKMELTVDSGPINYFALSKLEGNRLDIYFNYPSIDFTIWLNIATGSRDLDEISKIVPLNINISPSFVLFQGDETNKKLDMLFDFPSDVIATFFQHSVYLSNYKVNDCTLTGKLLLCKNISVSKSLPIAEVTIYANSKEIKGKLPLYEAIYDTPDKSKLLCQTKDITNGETFSSLNIKINQNKDDIIELELLLIKFTDNNIITRSMGNKTEIHTTFLINSSAVTIPGKYKLYLRNSKESDDKLKYQGLSDIIILLHKQIPKPLDAAYKLYGQTSLQQSVTFTFEKVIMLEFDFLKYQIKHESKEIKEVYTLATNCLNPQNPIFQCQMNIPMTFITNEKYIISTLNICNEMADLAPLILQPNTIMTTVINKLNAMNYYIFQIQYKEIVSKELKPIIKLIQGTNEIPIPEITLIEEGDIIKWESKISQNVLLEGIYDLHTINSPNTIINKDMIFYKEEIELTESELSKFKEEIMEFNIVFDKAIFDKRISSITYDMTNKEGETDSGTITKYIINGNTIEIQETTMTFIYAGKYQFSLSDISENPIKNHIFSVTVINKYMSFEMNWIFVIKTPETNIAKNKITFADEINPALVTRIRTNSEAFTFDLLPADQIQSEFQLQVTVNDLTQLGQYKGLLFYDITNEIIYKDEVKSLIIITEEMLPSEFKESTPTSLTFERSKVEFSVEVNQVLYSGYLKHNAITAKTKSGKVCQVSLNAENNKLIKIICLYPITDFTYEDSSIKEFIDEELIIKVVEKPLPSIMITITNCQKNEEWIGNDKRCQCILGYGIKEKTCTLYSITVTQKIIKMLENTQLSFNFNSIIPNNNRLKTVFLQNTKYEKFKIPCQKNNLNPSEWNCENTTNMIKIAGVYKLFYEEEHNLVDNQTIMPIYISEVTFYLNELLSIDPTKTLFLYNKKIKLKYEDSFNNDYSMTIQLYPNEDPIAVEKTSENNAKFIIQGTKNYNNIYHIITTINGFTTTSTPTIFIYQGDLKLEQTRKVLYDKGDLSIAFTIPIFTGRVKEITCNTPQNKIIILDPLSFIVNPSNPYKLTIVDSYKLFVDLGVYLFRIQDNGKVDNIQELTIYLKENFACPPGFLSSTIYYYTNTSPSMSITLSAAHYALITEVKTKEKKIDLVITQNTLTLANPSSPLNWGSYSQLQFIDQYNDIICSYPFNDPTPKKGLIIVNDKTIPQTLKQKEFIVKTNARLIYVSFKENFYQEYLDEKRVVIVKGAASLAYHASKLALEIRWSHDVTSQFLIELESFDIPLKITVIPKTCPDNQGMDSNGKCIICPNIAHNDHCINACPSNTILYEKKCYLSCRETETAQYYKKTQNCISKCHANDYVFEGEKICYEQCPLKHNNVALFSYTDGDVKKCVLACPDGMIPNLDNKCLKKSEMNCSNKNTQMICIQSCPLGTELFNNQCNYIYTGRPTLEICENYCKNNGKCTVVNKRRKCDCVDNYYGFACEYRPNPLSSPDDLKKLAQLIDDSIIKCVQVDDDNSLDLKNPYTIYHIKNIGAILIQKENVVDYIQETLIISLNELMMENLINDINWKRTFDEEYIPLISFLMKYSSLKTQNQQNANNHSLRSLQSYQEAFDTLKLITLEYIVKSHSTTMIRDSSPQISNDLDVFTVQVYTEKIASQEFYHQIADYNYLTYVNTTDCMREKNYTQFTIAKMDYKTPQSIAYNSISLTGINYLNEQKLDISSCAKLQIYLNLPIDESVNQTKYKYYKERGIDIYNPEEPAANNACYYNKELEYDLPLGYRKNELYENKTFEAKGSYCIYQGLDINGRKIEMNCTGMVNELGYTLNPKMIEKTIKDSDLAIECGGKTSSVVNNFAFWIFLTILLSSVTAILFITFFDTDIISNTRAHTIFDNDELLIKHIRVNSTFPTESTSIKPIKPLKRQMKANVNNPNKPSLKTKDIQIIIETPKEAGDYLLKNLIMLHPLVNLCNESVLYSTDIKIALLAFNILNLFGFNALLFSNKMLTNRMYDIDRDNFAYPMKAECPKVLLSIAISMCCTILIRLLVLVTWTDKETLKEKINQKEDNHSTLIREFWKNTFIRRIIALVFMICFTLFNFYYSVVFCGIYVKTQYGWFYSGVWALMLDWVLFAPLSIMIISWIDKCTLSCIFYVKQLFWF